MAVIQNFEFHNIYRGGCASLVWFLWCCII